MSTRPDPKHALAILEIATMLAHSMSYDEATGAMIIDGVRVDGMVTQHKAVLTVSDGTTPPRDYRPLAATGHHNYAAMARALIYYVGRKRSGYPIIKKREMTNADWKVKLEYLARNRERIRSEQRPPLDQRGGNTDSVYGRRRGIDGKLS